MTYDESFTRYAESLLVEDEANELSIVLVVERDSWSCVQWKIEQDLYNNFFPILSEIVLQNFVDTLQWKEWTQQKKGYSIWCSRLNEMLLCK